MKASYVLLALPVLISAQELNSAAIESAAAAASTAIANAASEAANGESVGLGNFQSYVDYASSMLPSLPLPELYWTCYPLHHRSLPLLSSTYRIVFAKTGS